MMLLLHPRSEEILVRGIDQFERLWSESEKIPRVMAISVYPYITGVPHRIGYFEKLFDHIQSKTGVVFKKVSKFRTGIANKYRMPIF